MKQPEKRFALHAMLEEIQRDYHKEAVRPLRELAPQKKHVISTGIPSLDKSTGIGGIPVGHVTEIYGDAMTGKTSIALQIAKQAQKKGPVLYIDADCGLSKYMLEGSGIQPDTFYLCHMSTMEDVFEMCRIAAQSFQLIVIDSLPSLVPEYEESRKLSEVEISKQGKLMSQFFRVITGRLAECGCTLLLINQVRTNPCILFGNSLQATCGRALKYYASLRIQTHLAGASTQRIEFCTITQKNKCAAPLGKAAFHVQFAFA